MPLFKRTKKEEDKKEQKEAAVEVARETTATVSAPVDTSGAVLFPHITEKASTLGTLNKYVFRVDKRATKIDIKRAIQKGYAVTVTKIDIINVRPKERRIGRTRGFRPGFKKAIVTVQSGQTIDVARA